MFQRLLIGKMEHRIIVGTLAFLGIMVLTGWIAINEGGRMRSFEQQFLARSVERGGGLFAANCTSCHGLDGRGLTGVAPALNNPQFFGHDFLAPINAEMQQLQAERGLEGLAADRAAEIDQRLQELQSEHDALVTQMQPAVDKGYDPEAPARLAQVGWVGPADAFIYTTLVHGRPTSISYWPQPMAAWSQTAGGPLRNDQLQDLVNYIENWDKGNNWTIEDLLAVNQFAKVPGEGGAAAGGDGSEPAGTDVQAILTAMESVTGDPVEGQSLYTAQGCSGCHSGGIVGPATEGTWTRIETERLAQPEFAGYTAEQYAVESIVDAHKYIVPGFSATMPTYFGERLSVQQIADLVAYLQSQDQ